MIDRVLEKAGLPDGRRERWAWLALLAVYCVEAFIVAWHGARLIGGFDTWTYIFAASTIEEGIPDLVRTPVYPAIISIFRSVFGSWWAINLCTFQLILLAVAALVLRKTAIQYTGNRRVAFAVCAIFLLWTGGLDAAREIMTENMAACGMVFWTRCMSRHESGRMSVADATWSTFWLAFLVFLRPIMLYLIPIALAYALIVLWRSKSKKGPVAALAGVALVCVMVGVYRQSIHRHYGINSISIVSMWNNSAFAEEAGLDFMPIFGEVEAVKVGDPYRDPYMEVALPEGPEAELVKCYWNRVETDINTKIISNPRKAYMVLKERVLKTMEYSCTMNGGKWAYRLSASFAPNFGLYLIFMAVMGALCFRQWWRERRIPLETAFWICLCVGMYAASVAGAMADWDRMSYPVFPIFLLLAGKFSTLFTKNGEGM